MKTCLRHLLVLAVAAFAPMAQADFYLIVPAANPQPALTQHEAVGLFMGRNRAFHSGEVSQVYDLPRDSTQRAEFYQRLTGMGPAQINSYWARLMFSGQTMPPYAVPDEAAMVAVVKSNANAIGWVRKDPNDKALRVLLVLKDPT